MPGESCDILIIGAGPAGLRAAEIVSTRSDRRVLVVDRMPSAGRKFLVAGRGGLNLTHSENLESFLPRYGAPRDRWRSLLADFSQQDLRAWAAELGIETFIGTSGRVFPLEKKAAPLLRRWIARLRAQEVGFRFRRRLVSLAQSAAGGWRADFDEEGTTYQIEARKIVLALGGASWPETGSDGHWTDVLSRAGVALAPFVAANCGYEVAWPASFLGRAEGQPLKNVVVRAAGEAIAGELLVTRAGLEGGVIYQLGPALRRMGRPEITIDLKPTFSTAQLMAKAGPILDLERAARAWKLSPAATELLRLHTPFASPQATAACAKMLPIALLRPRPIEEAISSAGGVRWEGLDENLMLRPLPGIFCAGEMIDWEAPTGGYLLQGCMATGTRAGRGAVASHQPPNGG